MVIALQNVPDLISIFEKLGTPIAIFLIVVGIFLKVFWPWFVHRQDKRDAARDTEAARVAAVLDNQVKWAREREDTILKELTATLREFSKNSERTDGNVRLVLEELRRK